MLPVPFHVGNAHRGASEMKGVAYVDGEDLVVEMQVKLWSLFKRPSQTFRIDLTDLDTVRHKRGWFGDAVTVRTRPMELAAEIPGSSDGAFCFQVKRKDRSAADALLERLELWLID